MPCGESSGVSVGVLSGLCTSHPAIINRDSSAIHAPAVRAAHTRRENKGGGGGGAYSIVYRWSGSPSAQ